MEPATITLIAAIGGAVATLGKIITQFLLDEHREEKTETIEDRVSKLTRALQETTSLINNIEQEIKARSELATQLQEDAERYKQIVELKKPEVEAVAQLLRGELKAESSKSFWKGVFVNFIFFLLGAAASYGINLITMK